MRRATPWLARAVALSSLLAGALRVAGVAAATSLALMPLAAAAATQDTSAVRGYAPLRADGNGIDALRRRIRLDVMDQPLAEVLRAIQRQANLDLVFGADLPGLDRRVTLLDTAGTAATLLLRTLEGLPLEVLVARSGQAVIVPRRSVQPDRYSVAGTVRESATGRAIDLVDVTVFSPARNAQSDAGGRFLLTDLPPGAHTLRARRFGYAESTLTFTVPLTAALEIAMRAAPTPLAALVVTPGVFGVLEESLTPRRALTRDDIEIAPQLGEDPFRAIARLPGIAGHDLSAAFSVRGGSNRESLLRLDGVDLVEPFHLKDLDAALSIIDIDAIGGIELMTGGFGVEFGDRLGGVFDMRTSSVAPGSARTTLGLSLTNARAASRGSFAGDRGRWLASIRRGYIDLALKLGKSEDRLSPRFYDALAKVEYELNPRLLLSAHVLHAGDKLRYHDNGDDPDLDSEYGSSYAWIKLDAEPTDRLGTRTVASVAWLSWQRLGFGRRPEHHRNIEVRDARSFDAIGLRQDWQFQASDDLILRAGFDLKAQRADYEYFGWAEQFPFEDGRVVPALDTTIVAAAPTGNYAGAHLAARWRPLAPLTLEVGTRWDHYTHIDESRLSPRVNAALALRPATTLRMAWGTYAQAQGLHELQTPDGDVRFYPVERAEHRVLGIEHALRPGIDLRLEAYDERFTAMRPRFVSREDTGELFPELVVARIRIDPEIGFARGIEMMARKRAPRGFNGSVMYARSSSRQKIDGQWVPRPRDQRNAFAIDASWGSARGWRLSSAWQWHSGWPRTPVTLHVDTVNNQIEVYREFGTYNTARLPAYHRMDVRVSRQFATNRGRVLLYVDVYNLYGRENARSLDTYLDNIVNGKPVYGYAIDSLLPRLPSFGVQWEF